MTANQHPYQAHVVDDVAIVLAAQTLGLSPWDELHKDIKDAYRDSAHEALQALWKADQPHKLSADEARTIWFKAVDAHNGDYESLHELRLLLAQHAPDWGNHDR